MLLILNLWGALIFTTIPLASLLPLSGIREDVPTPVSTILIPPIIKYWARNGISPSAYAQVNATIWDHFGRPWYCTTYLQSNCKPLFTIPTQFKETQPSVRSSAESQQQKTTTVNQEKTTASIRIDIETNDDHADNHEDTV